LSKVASLPADGWEKRWVKSSWKEKEGTAGEWIHTAGKWYGDKKADKGKLVDLFASCP
jgi:hypothetical protein